MTTPDRPETHLTGPQGRTVEKFGADACKAAFRANLEGYGASGILHGHRAGRPFSSVREVDVAINAGRTLEEQGKAPPSPICAKFVAGTFSHCPDCGGATEDNNLRRDDFDFEQLQTRRRMWVAQRAEHLKKIFTNAYKSLDSLFLNVYTLVVGKERNESERRQ